MKNKDLLKGSQRLTRNKRKSDSINPEVYTTLSTGRVSKQRLPLTPIKSLTNKRKRKTDVSDDDAESSSDDDQEDEDYDDKYVNRKMKQEGGNKRQNSNSEEGNERSLQTISQLLPAIQMRLDSSKTPEEVDFLIRLNSFMAERAYAYPKIIWGLRDGKQVKIFQVISNNCIQYFSKSFHNLHSSAKTRRIRCNRR